MRNDRDFFLLFIINGLSLCVNVTHGADDHGVDVLAIFLKSSVDKRGDVRQN